MLLNSQMILDAVDKKTVKVPVPEWGENGEVLICSMGALDIMSLMDWAKQQDKKKDDPNNKEIDITLHDDMEFKIRYLINSIIDPATQKPCFTMDQVTALGEKNHIVINRIYEEAIKLNRSDVKTRQELEKN